MALSLYTLDQNTVIQMFLELFIISTKIDICLIRNNHLRSGLEIVSLI